MLRISGNLSFIARRMEQWLCNTLQMLIGGSDSSFLKDCRAAIKYCCSEGQLYLLDAEKNSSLLPTSSRSVPMRSSTPHLYAFSITLKSDNELSFAKINTIYTKIILFLAKQCFSKCGKISLTNFWTAVLLVVFIFFHIPCLKYVYYKYLIGMNLWWRGRLRRPSWGRSFSGEA